jgi:Zn-dependent metalloprotease
MCIRCIISPNMHEHLARHTDAVVRDAALRSLNLAQSARTRRQVKSSMLAQGFAGLGESAPQPRPHLFRTIYDAQHQESGKGVKILEEGSVGSPDPDASRVYDALGLTFNYYWEAHQRNSLDDKGADLDALVHVGTDLDNAYYDGWSMNFGDGDGKIFGDFTINPDVTVHELSHGVMQYTADWPYHGEPGAANEANSDIFARCAVQWSKGWAVEEDNWLIGQGLILNHPDMALRSMANPGTAYDTPDLGHDTQPDHYSRFVHTLRDNGGVHTNSGILNRYFYLAAMGCGGHVWEGAALVWYACVTDPKQVGRGTFKSIAKTCNAYAQKFFGAQSVQAKAFDDASHQTGIN